MQTLLSLYRRLNIRLGGSAVIDQAVVGGTNFLMAVVVGRLCGPTELGLFALATTTWYLVLAFLESLITSPFTVFVHRLDEEGRTTYAGSAIVHLLGLAAIVTTLLFVVAALLYWLEYTELSVVIAALAVTIPLRFLREFARRFHYASLNLNRALVLDISVAALQALALAALYYCDLLSAAGAFLAVGSAYAVVLLVWLARHSRSFRIRRKRLYVDLLRNWALGRWLAASQLSMIVASQSLPWIIAFVLDESQAGIYFSCAMLVNIGSPLLVAVQNVLAPRSAAAFAESGLTGLRHVVKQTTVGLVLCIGLFAIVLVFGGDFLLRFIFGVEYGGYQKVISLLAINGLAYASMLGAASGLTVLERTDLLFRSILVGILVTVTMGVSLIGLFGLPGAAMAQLAGTAIASVTVMFCYRRVVNNLQECGASGPSEQIPNVSPKSSSADKMALES